MLDDVAHQISVLGIMRDEKWRTHVIWASCGRISVQFVADYPQLPLASTRLVADVVLWQPIYSAARREAP